MTLAADHGPHFSRATPSLLDAHDRQNTTEIGRPIHLTYPGFCPNKPSHLFRPRSITIKTTIALAV